MQMDPQFLFATLRSVSTLIHQDVEAADDLVASLSELLRISLDDADEQEVTLKREIEYLNAYLEVQQIRFRNRLAVLVTVDPRSLDALVPNMIMPALVENILRRGFDEVNRAGQVEILTEVRDGKLRIEIRDDLAAELGTGKRGFSIPDLGLANTKARLQHLYGASHNFTVGLKAPGGSRLTLEIPLVMRTARPANGPSDPTLVRGELVLRQRAKQFGIILGLWTATGFLYGCEIYFFNAHVSRAIDLHNALFRALPDMWIYAALTPAVLWFYSHFRFRREKWPLLVAIHLVAVVDLPRALVDAQGGALSGG